MATVPNRDPYVHADSPDNFQLEGGFVRQPRPISAAESQLHQPGAKEFWVEYYHRNFRGGRLLAGPYSERRFALARATELLAETDYSYEVSRVSVLTFVKGGAA
jgi:hypothetical protein